MRPPYGSIDKHVSKILTNLGYKIIMWNLDSNDWRYITCNGGEILRNVQQKLKSYSNQTTSWIALFHDVHLETAQLQERVIKYILEQNFKIVNLDECIQDSKPHII